MDKKDKIYIAIVCVLLLALIAVAFIDDYFLKFLLVSSALVISSVGVVYISSNTTVFLKNDQYTKSSFGGLSPCNIIP